MLNEVRCEGEVDGPGLDVAQVAGALNQGFHVRRDMMAEAVPEIDGDLAARAHVIDEVPVAGAEFEDARTSRHKRLEIALNESLPEHVAARIGREARVVISGDAGYRGCFHPNKIPAIMRRPTPRARQSLVLPPLLSPTRP